MSQKRRNIAQRFALMRVFPSCVLVSSLYRIAFAYSRCLSSAAQWINKVNAWVGWCLVGRLEGAWCGGRGVVRCGRLTVGLLGPTYLITHFFCRRYSCFVSQDKSCAASNRSWSNRRCTSDELCRAPPHTSQFTCTHKYYLHGTELLLCCEILTPNIIQNGTEFQSARRH